MDFDPLELFTPTSSSFTTSISKIDTSSNHLNSARLVASSDKSRPDEKCGADEDEHIDEEDGFLPIHIHDLPLLRCLPPLKVLISFLRLLSPETSLNFAPISHTHREDTRRIDPLLVLAKKNVDMDVDAWLWLQKFCPRFGTETRLADLPLLADSLKKTFSSQYNAWLTQLISCEFAWISQDESTEIQTLAALRIAENCGRTAQPEMLRAIEIPMLPTKLLLKEPSLTSDNLGLKTWGSSFVLGSRLALQTHKEYLLDPVLELGAGTGLVGMVACCLGHTTMLTDLAEIVPNLQNNIELNGIENARVAELDWSNPKSFLQRFGNVKYSTIILSDPLYSSHHPQWIVNMLNLFLSQEKDSRVLLQVPVRRTFEKERASLWRLMEENGYLAAEECEELGYDDFGESSFIFKKYIRAD
ncbi:hypothetical protein METBIDRAFT_32846 [Metschnikowia bicuspidata var. bicuspidata NRRL YB-4993]|uniref:S-adenosyl-L-methionine-dependent methyltransferase n=1 Tax=Metschnikowia bicuspidata var. bicuspidata NRRL YB-4993 TaxID=869754 RepID=A0A1A0H7A4_9ASCO|nr:hypothetical protein METBIDRAFT_32846 [Metschnikowia bicuspidata var. bicuspidata NRRL YB-4993]OBA19777.1 hypothetical protein METBIDRAFT_32846 [Metschnikowia bicuspidata var. bicuspidata NRRL YB-4993]